MIIKELLRRLGELYEERRFGYDRLARVYNLFGITSVTMRLVPKNKYSPPDGPFPDGWSELDLNVEIEPNKFSFYDRTIKVAHGDSEGQIPHMQKDRVWATAERRVQGYKNAFEKHGIVVVF